MGYPIYRRTNSAIVALHAVAILPRTVVAVRGFESLVARPLPFTILSLANGCAIVVLMNVSFWAARGVFPAWMALIFLLLGVFIVAWLLSFKIMSSRLMDFFLPPVTPSGGNRPTERPPDEKRSLRTTLAENRIQLTTLFVTLVVVPLWWVRIWEDINRNPSWERTFVFITFSAKAIFPQVHTLGWVSLAVVALTTYYFAARWAAQRELNLADVKITIADPSGDETVNAKLLDHSGGTWYLFDKQWTLKVIPDGQVKEAEVYEKSDQHPTTNEP